jgi:hypothetical protein
VPVGTEWRGRRGERVKKDRRASREVAGQALKLSVMRGVRKEWPRSDAEAGWTPRSRSISGVTLSRLG